MRSYYSTRIQIHLSLDNHLISDQDSRIIIQIKIENE